MNQQRSPLRRTAVLVVAFPLLLGCGGCGGSETEAPKTFKGEYPIKVVCTTGMVADLVREVGGEHVEVTQLMQEGIDPHRYQANPGDVRQLSEADAIFYSGRNLEGKMGSIFERMARRKLTVGVTDKLDSSKILTDENNHNDPHLWFDVSLWSQAVDVVRDELIAFDSKHADEYTANAKRYREQLEKLHEETKKRIAEIPKSQRVLVTAHDAFQYFGRAYDIEVRGIQGISTESEASGKKITELVKFLADRKIKAVFVESSVPKRYVQALQEGCRKDFGHEVKVGGELFSDAMGEPGTPEGTYEGMVRHNVKTIVEALK